MVGDGINDAPSMAASNISISFNNASNLTIDTADIVIMDSKSINKIQLAHKICKKTYSTIKQNLYWALGYNFIAIPLACAGLLNPMWAALFMAFYDIVVIGNSLRSIFLLVRILANSSFPSIFGILISITARLGGVLVNPIRALSPSI